MKLNEIRDAYMSEGASYLDASSRTSQEVVMSLIAKSPFSKNVTIKGGVMMRHISEDDRRATQDLDLDFIKYSISGASVRRFIETLNRQSNEFSINIIEPIEKLKHQDYNGKRAIIRITDIDGTSIDTKLDMGVHKNIRLKQKDCCFDLGKLDDSVTLLANTEEQIFAEKLKSLLRLGAVSTRYKDVFDMYYLVTQGRIIKSEFISNLKYLIFDDETMRENNIGDIFLRLEQVLNDSRFTMPLSRSKRHNWLSADTDQVTKGLLNFFRGYEK
jgi:predicted nucleotidyltransferase component of viral defense system